jgi:hypothetical protein
MWRRTLPALAGAAGIALLSTGLTVGKPSSEFSSIVRVVAFGKDVTVTEGVVENGRMLIPIGDRRGMLRSAHAFFDGLGAQALYDPYFRHLTIGIAGSQLEFLGDNSYAMLDGAPYVLDVRATLHGDVYYVPVHSIARAFGISIDWRRANRVLAFGGVPRTSVAAAPSPVSDLPSARPVVAASTDAIPTMRPETPSPPPAVRYVSAEGQVQPHEPFEGSAHASAEVASARSVGALLGADYTTGQARADAYAGVGAPDAGHIYATVGAVRESTSNGSVAGIAYGAAKLPDLDLPVGAYAAGSGRTADESIAEYLGVGVRF